MYLRENTLLQGGKYKITRYISHGGFGCTYEAVNTTMRNRRVAIKELFVSDFCNRDTLTGCITVTTQSKIPLFEKLRNKFLDEAETIMDLNHPGIVRVTDFFEENGTAYYVMDYIDGYSLRDLVKRVGALSEQTALLYIRQVADALQYVHGKSRLHLDIKPANIMVNNEGKAILIDFGVSKQYDEVSGENTSSLLGHSPGYAPPEQANNKIGKFLPATDIYALGATLYNLLTGIVPPTSSELAAGEELPPMPSTITPATHRAIKESVILNKLARPQSIAEFLAILEGGSAHSDETQIEEEEDIKRREEEPQKKRRDTESSQKKKLSKIYAWSLLILLMLLGGALLFESIVDSQNHTSNDYTLINTEQERWHNLIPVVYVSGGTFTMGATSEQGSDVWSSEIPTHQVTVSSFYMGKYEVTQAQWEAVMGTTVRQQRDKEDSSYSLYGIGGNYPIYYVSHEEAVEFCRKLSSLTGRTYRLPTEAEWEYAARGGNQSRGYKYSGSDDLNSVAWYDDNSGSTTHEVGTKRANELGLYDMSGNVLEWCSDWIDGDYYSYSPQTNPKGPGSGSSRVNRGGSWRSDASICRVSLRNGNAPSNRYSKLGFRVVLEP